MQIEIPGDVPKSCDTCPMCLRLSNTANELSIYNSSIVMCCAKKTYIDTRYQTGLCRDPFCPIILPLELKKEEAVFWNGYEEVPASRLINSNYDPFNETHIRVTTGSGSEEKEYE